jgi:hypothetical protein
MIALAQSVPWRAAATHCFTMESRALDQLEARESEFAVFLLIHSLAHRAGICPKHELRRPARRLSEHITKDSAE